MNDALNLYENESKVISISSFNFFAKSKQIPDFFFCQIIDCWGWATWRRGWSLFEKDGTKLLNEIDNRQLRDKFNANGAYDYYAMLEAVSKKKIDSWAICWYASGFINNKFSLYPKISLTENIGFDGSGINSNTHKYISVGGKKKRPTPNLIKSEIQNNPNALAEFYEYFHPPEVSFFKRWITKFLKWN
jgi:hypothetical protein